MDKSVEPVAIRASEPRDFEAIAELCKAVYPASAPWRLEQLESHHKVFPDGQLVAVASDGRPVGFAASLIVFWDDYEMGATWKDFTAGGMFTNHDPARGKTLYGAEVMVDPGLQGRGIGKRLYEGRRDIVRRHGLLRIRAGARLRGYHRHAERLSPEDYTMAVVEGRLQDPTLTFQLGQGFHVIGIASGYIRRDPESLGHAAVIEWLNSEVARPEDYGPMRASRFYRPPPGA